VVKLRRIMKKAVIMLLGVVMFCKSTSANNWLFTDSETGVQVNYQFTIPENQSNSLVLNLIVVENGQNFNYSPIILNEENCLNKAALSDLLTEKYNIANSNFGTEALKRHFAVVDKFLIHRDNHDLDVKHSFVFQGLAMYRSMLNAAVRSADGSGVSFKVSESYILNLSSFICEEDYSIDVTAFSLYLQNRKVTDPTNEGLDYFLNAFVGNSNVSMSSSEIENLLRIYFENPNNKDKIGRPFMGWPRGSDCGCCGNYNGPCFYWAIACLIHDYQCQTCTPRWYCLSGCVASKCGAIIPHLSWNLPSN
jgi:hypothetical protein